MLRLRSSAFKPTVRVGVSAVFTRPYSASLVARSETKKKVKVFDPNKKKTGLFKEYKHDYQPVVISEADRIRTEAIERHTKRIMSAADEPVEEAREPGVGERAPEPEVFIPHKFRGIDRRSLAHRIHSAVGNRPFWGPSGSWQQISEEVEEISRRSMEARGQTYTPPVEDWRELSKQRREKTERDKKAREEAEANVVKRDEKQIAALMEPLGLSEFAEKFHSLDHVLSIKTVELKKMGIECQKRKLLLRHTEIIRQRAARGLVLFPGAGPAVPPTAVPAYLPGRSPVQFVRAIPIAASITPKS